MTQLKLLASSFGWGVVFAIGLGISGMTEASKILAFLDVLGEWQGELILVMGGAVGVYSLLYPLIRRKSKPLLDKQFDLPTKRAWDMRLVLGAAMFGVGWGMTGLCPGPGIVGLVSGTPYAVVFVVTMLIGMAFGRSTWVQKASQKN